MVFNTNLFRRPTELVHSSVNPHTHWAIVKFTSQRDQATLLTVAYLKRICGLMKKEKKVEFTISWKTDHFTVVTLLP